MVASNTLLTPTIIARDALRLLTNNLVWAPKVYRQAEKEFRKVGDTVTLRLPNKFIVSDGKTRVNQDLKEPSVALQVDKQKHVSWSYSSSDMTLTIAEYRERYLAPAMEALANKIDMDIAALTVDFYNHLGTPGTAPTALSAITGVNARMTQEAFPKMGRIGIMDPNAYNGMVSGDFKAFYSQKITEAAVEKGIIRMAGGLEIEESANAYSHTCGTYDPDTDTPLIDTVGPSWTPANGDSTIYIDGFDAAQNGKKVLLKGDVLTIAGVYAVNPISYTKLPYLRDFVVTEDVTYTHSTAYATVKVSPTIYSSTTTGADKPYQTVDTLPVNNAAVTIKTGKESATHLQSLFFHKEAMALALAPLEMPDGVWGAQERYEGFSVRILKDYDYTNDEQIIRCDVLYGVKTIRPDLGIRLTS